MRIAIDIDKTIFDCDSFIYKTANTIMPRQKFNRELKYKYVDDNISSKKGFLANISKIYNPSSYYVDQNTSRITKKWKDNNYEVILLSSRPASKSLINVLLICLKRWDIYYNKLVVACNNKVRFCLEHGVDLIIDDSFSNCYNCIDKGINAIWYTTKPLVDDVSQFNSFDFKIANRWTDIEKIVDNMVKSKKR